MKLQSIIIPIKNYKNFITYFMDRFGFIKDEYVKLILRNGLEYKIRSGSADRMIINEICVYKLYNPEHFAIGRHDTVLDIGAQAGIFSLYASLLAREGRVFSFEPVQQNFSLLKENISLNQASNITAINKAVSNTTGKEVLFFDKKNTGGHSFFAINAKEGDAEKVTVPTISLNDFFKQYNVGSVDFLKMDCEGAEYKILFNCLPQALSMIKKISMEYHDIDEKYNVKTMKVFLEKNGFRVSLHKSQPFLYAIR